MCVTEGMHVPAACAGLQIAEASQLVGVWLTARCVRMQMLGMSMGHYWLCLAMLAAIGLGFRALALAALFLNNRARQK